MMDLLENFAAAAAAGSFSQVARAHRLAVSSVTRKVTLLEAELGTRLFSRSPRRLLLTDAGELFLPHAKAMLADMADAKEGLSNLNSDPRGLLTVTAPTEFGRLHVVPAVMTFLKTYPLVEIDLHLSDDVVDLTSRRVDIAIRMGLLPDSDLVATPLAPLHRLACASPDYIAKHGHPSSPIELLHHNCLTSASLPVIQGWWCFDGVNRGLPLAVTGTFRSDNTGALLQAAVAGIGVVHLADWLVNDMIVAGKLVALFADLPGSLKPKSAIHAVRMPGRSHTKKAQLFVSHLRSTFGTPPYWEAS